MPANNAVLTRRIALTVVNDVVCKKNATETAFEKAFKENPLEKRDEAFVRLLVMTFLRHKGEAQVLWNRFLQKPLSEKERYVRDALSLGVIQAVYLKTPSYAVVSPIVSILKHYKRGAFAPLANAVLRQVVRQEDPVAAAPEKNFPEWLDAALTDAYGIRTTRKIQEAFLNEPPLDISVKNDAEAWAKRLNGVKIATDTVRCANDGDVMKKAGYDDGQWWVQDLSASLPVKIMKDLSGAEILDVCAAPGGKTAQLCAAGAHVTALDVSENRLKRLKSNMDRLRFSPKTVCADFRKWDDGVLYDGVLLDAPCSATGTIRRHPDVLYHRTREDIARLAAVQSELLEKAVKKTVVGGLIVYGVCSILPEEGEKIIEAFLKKGTVVRRPVAAPEIPSVFITPKGDVLCLPCHMADIGGCDGFFAARLQRVR